MARDLLWLVLMITANFAKLIQLSCLAAVLVLGSCIDDSEQPDQSVAESSQEISAGDSDVSDVPGCPGVWNYIESFAGFVGTYARFSLAPEGEIARLSVLSLETQAETIFVSGFYQRSVRSGFWGQQQTGKYLAVPINPAIGSVIIFADSPGEDYVDGYAIIGERRSLITDRISQLCVAKFDSTSENGVATPFVLSRWF